MEKTKTGGNLEIDLRLGSSGTVSLIRALVQGDDWIGNTLYSPAPTINVNRVRFDYPNTFGARYKKEWAHNDERPVCPKRGVSGPAGRYGSL